jgi:ABC-type transport system involved in multi-copper enzyme maturation permease subunit
MWRSLVWKEWHEQRWRLWFGVALLTTFTVTGLRTRIMPDEQIVMFSMIVGGIFFPLMVAMGLIAPERAEGTIVRLLALPVPPWKVLAAKMVMGWVVCVAPLLASAAVAAIVAGDRELAWKDFAVIYAIAVSMSVATLAWLTAAGVRQPSEARAGIAGIAVLFAWFLVVATCAMLGAEVFQHTHLDEWVAAATPMGMTMLRSEFVPPAAVIAIQLASVALVLWWSARRIARPGKVVA